MSHFVRCDRCDTEEHVMGTINLPPGWQKICNADLCEPCCMMVRDFIRFKASDAARLPVEPIPKVATLAPVGDKLFETAPEPQVSADPLRVSEQASNGKLVPKNGADGDPEGQTQPASAESPTVECSTEERLRTRAVKRRKKLQDAPPDNRAALPHGENEVQP
jgi:hypothetical protein